jgi:hypothetical protein
VPRAPEPFSSKHERSRNEDDRATHRGEGHCTWPRRRVGRAGSPNQMRCSVEKNRPGSLNIRHGFFIE